MTIFSSLQSKSATTTTKPPNTCCPGLQNCTIVASYKFSINHPEPTLAGTIETATITNMESFGGGFVDGDGRVINVQRLCPQLPGPATLDVFLPEELGGASYSLTCEQCCGPDLDTNPLNSTHAGGINCNIQLVSQYNQEPTIEWVKIDSIVCDPNSAPCGSTPTTTTATPCSPCSSDTDCYNQTGRCIGGCCVSCIKTEIIDGWLVGGEPFGVAAPNPEAGSFYAGVSKGYCTDTPPEWIEWGISYCPACDDCPAGSYPVAGCYQIVHNGSVERRVGNVCCPYQS